MRLRLIDFKNITFEADVDEGMGVLKFYVDWYHTSPCELEKITGLAFDDMVLAIMKGDLKVEQFPEIEKRG